MKYYITKKSDIGKQGEGQYILQDPITKKVKSCQSCMGTKKIVDESQKQLTDVSVLLEPAIKNGLLRHSTKFTEEYDDIPSITYQDALQTVATATQMFQELPNAWRKRFHNDPKEFLEFTANPENATEMQKMGMLKGNDGLTSTGAPSGAPTTTDKNGNGVPDSTETATSV